MTISVCCKMQNQTKSKTWQLACKFLSYNAKPEFAKLKVAVILLILVPYLIQIATSMPLIMAQKFWACTLRYAVIIELQ